MTYTAFVPARSGSKRLPNKNVAMLAGKPLVVWTLEACVRIAAIESVILSTDSRDYWNIVRDHMPSSKLELDFRTHDEAGDRVKIFDYLKGFRDRIFGGRSGAFVLALPTVPLRRSQHIEEALTLFERHGDPVFSATAYGFPVSFAFHTGVDGRWRSLSDDNPMITGNTRSQDQAQAYHPNGAIYVRLISDLGRPDLATLYQGARPYLMDRADSVDIDDATSLDYVRFLMESRRTEA